ncbi:MAG: hypothetical protein HZB13_18965, partial [Acidobacteria bacterium]|nr:hypothetical protein [Acidobacteriota bacterium]
MYSTVSLLVYTFGLTAFLGLFALWVRQRRLGRPELRGWLYPAIFLSSAAWFALNIYTINYFVLLAGACVFPPLLGRLVGARGTPLLAAGSIAVAVYCLFHSDAAYPGSPEFVYASVPFTLLIAWATASALRRRPGKGNVFILLAATVIIPLAIFTWHNWLSLVMRSLPLTILLVDSYSRRRFLFLDLFAKWGSYFALTLTALTFWF